MSIYDTHKPKSGGGLYLRLADGETVKLRIFGDPVIFESVGERDGKTTLSTKYAWLVWNQEAKIPQILQQSATFFKNVAALARDSEWGDPTLYDIKITRNGAGFNDTTYTLNPSINRDPLPAEAEAELNKIDLIASIEASPFSQHVMWLSDFDNGGPQESPKEPAAAPAPAPVQKENEDNTPPAKTDTVADVKDADPVNLDDIPF